MSVVSGQLADCQVADYSQLVFGDLTRPLADVQPTSWRIRRVVSSDHVGLMLLDRSGGGGGEGRREQVAPGGHERGRRQVRRADQAN